MVQKPAIDGGTAVNIEEFLPWPSFSEESIIHEPVASVARCRSPASVVNR